MNKFNNLFWKNKYLKMRLLRYQMFIVHSGSIRTHPWPEYCEVTSHNPWLDNDCQIKHFCDIWVFDRYQGIWWIWEVVRKLLLRLQCCFGCRCCYTWCYDRVCSCDISHHPKIFNIFALELMKKRSQHTLRYRTH